MISSPILKAFLKSGGKKGRKEEKITKNGGQKKGNWKQKTDDFDFEDFRKLVKMGLGRLPKSMKQCTPLI